MRYASLDAFLTEGRGALAKGPVGLILVEDLVEVESTIRHHLKAGFHALLVLAPDELRLPPDLEGAVHRIPYRNNFV